jgi:hypothetical protein
MEYSGNVVDGTVVPVTFGGSGSVTIPVGREIWSDATKLTWVDGDGDEPNLQGRNLAVSYAIAGDSGPVTFHSGANQTSFITAAGSGDHTVDLDVFAYEFTTASWFFIDAADVMAPADTIVVCAFGDSITDGTHTTFNINDRWSNVLSRRLHNAYGNNVSVVNEAIGGKGWSTRWSSPRPRAKPRPTGSTATCSGFPASPMWSGSKASTIWAAATLWRPLKRATRVSSPRSMRTASRSWAPP